MSALTEKIVLFFSDKEHKLGELTVDAFLSESHELKAKVTEHPLENGSSFVDHIYNLPISIQLEGIISNTPTTLLGLTVYNSIKNGSDLVNTAFTKLEEIFAKREPLTISTSLKDYPNMVLESLSVERKASSSSSALRFSCAAKQIRIVTQDRIHVPIPKVERAKPKKQMGKQETKALPKSEAPKVEELKKTTSVLHSWFGS